MRMLKLKAGANSAGFVLINPNRITRIEPIGEDSCAVHTQDMGLTEVNVSADELERRFEEITQPGKTKTLRIVSKYMRRCANEILFRVDRATSPEDYATLLRFLEESSHETR